MVRELLLVGAGLVGATGCLNLDVDPQGQAPETLTAIQWEAWDADSDTLIEKGCAEGRPTLHATKGERVRLRLSYERVHRRAGLTSEACSTTGDISRAPQTEVLAPSCYRGLADGGPAELVSFETIPASAREDGIFAKAAGYEYVLSVLRSGTLLHDYAPSCDQLDDAASVAELLVRD